MLLKNCFHVEENNHNDISEECGFSSPSYFSKVFRDMTGQTPREYQKHCHMAEK